jgi:hypothetical protein
MGDNELWIIEDGKLRRMPDAKGRGSYTFSAQETLELAYLLIANLWSIKAAVADAQGLSTTSSALRARAKSKARKEALELQEGATGVDI